LLTKNQKARLRAGAMLWENKAFLSWLHFEGFPTGHTPITWAVTMIKW
jgi:hypothetical protein